MKKKIRIFIPDAGPLISLAMGDALDLLLLLSADVRLILTDVVNYEAAHRSDDLDDAKKLKDFLANHADRIEIESTFFGKLALEDLERKKARGESATLPRDAGEVVQHLFCNFPELVFGNFLIQAPARPPEASPGYACTHA